MEQAVNHFINQRPLQRVTARAVLDKGMATVQRFTGDALLLHSEEAELHVLCADSDQAALAILEEAGWIVGLDDTPPEGGRPTMRYYVNPKARAAR